MDTDIENVELKNAQDGENIESKNAHDFDTLLAQIEVSTLTERDKGTQFETLVRTFLALDAEYKDLYTEIYTVKEFAKSYPDYKINARDAGVDLYCKNKDDNMFTAVQCKFYKKDNKIISKKDLNTFLAESDKTFISKRLFVTTQDIDITDNAELASTHHNRIPLSFITRRDFYQSSLDWSSYVKGEYKQIEKRTLRPYQKEVIKNSLNGFKTNSRGTIIMACGTGKTFTSLRLCEEYLNSIGGGYQTCSLCRSFTSPTFSNS